ncbi:Sgt2p Ecym_3025 [Eremothecium cymbalariae DBVPG|uniref:STI1 domain-containing protein n=1 Tax=Eremothecium cymbalariae (strain CBS 270.75 / DBVPG 7215 / KCTC 17166 / NRRL Y-17582) TaxID=931890 RepID=G8JQX2_ERECY|nr:Hypothetical protein Ecym_3025 [Eremothecium cymbalariae DBVPG\
MPGSNKEIAALIVQFLSTSTKDVQEEYVDSLNVAIDCIAEAFEIEREDSNEIVSKAYNGRGLVDLVKSGASEPTLSSSEPTGNNTDAHAPEVAERAENLKLEGNKAFAAKDFEGAVKKYTEAIELMPNNAVFYGNRAAAYSSFKKFEEAVRDAESAVRINPSYSRGYSRLGLAKYALGKPEEAMEAYKKVLDIEGDNATEAMKRDYESAKKKVEESLNLEALPKGEEQQTSEGSSAGGFPDLSSMLGGGLGGLLNNPQVMQAAQKMMQNPSAMQEMMNNPAIKQMAQNFASGGGTPNLGDMMKDPNIKDMAGKFFGQK